MLSGCDGGTWPTRPQTDTLPLTETLAPPCAEPPPQSLPLPRARGEEKKGQAALDQSLSKDPSMTHGGGVLGVWGQAGVRGLAGGSSQPEHGRTRCSPSPTCPGRVGGSGQGCTRTGVCARPHPAPEWAPWLNRAGQSTCDPLRVPQWGVQLGGPGETGAHEPHWGGGRASGSPTPSHPSG